jgi:hypothetical protein
MFGFRGEGVPLANQKTPMRDRNTIDSSEVPEREQDQELEGGEDEKG